MAQTVKLLSHQARFVQAPYVFPDTRFFILCGGFACGKTSSLVYAVMHAIKLLLGKKDKEGHNPKIMVCSKNITFLAKTWTNAFEQNLKMTNSEYTFDRAKNIIVVGNVELILVPTEEPANIYGYSCFRGDTLISTDKGEKPISDVKEGDFVLTTEGFKKVLKNVNQGVKDCIKVTVDNTDIYCTSDHRFIDEFNNEIEAKDLTKETLLVKYESSTKNFTTAHLTAKTSNVVGQYTVYDLCVEGCHEFFANGVRVHNCALAVVDELDELPTGIAMEAVKSINDRVRQQIDGFRSPFICFATTSQGLKGLYQTVLHFQKAGIGYLLMRARTRDNTYLPADYVKNMYSIYNEKEVACLLEGQFVSIDSGLVFPDYDPKKNKLDVDLFDSIADDDTVYIGQDFNCTTGDVLIETLKGRVKMKDIKVGDYVLTRKGYKKVLHKVCKGVKMVQDFNNGLVATADHVAITPDGEMELCRAKRFYCLQKQNTELLKEERKALLTVLKLKKLLLKEKCIRETQKEATVAQSTSIVEKNFCIEPFTKSILEKYKKEIRYTIKTVSMTTDLKVLKKCLMLNTRKNTSLKKLACILKLPKENLESIISLLQGNNSTVEYLKTLGKAENILVKLFVWTVALYSKQKSEPHNVVSSARSNGICIERESVIKALNEFVLFVESILQEQVRQSIVKNTKVIGKDLIGNERKEKVYDISVEDAHEFYANGILVHNCFGNHAVALVVKKFTDGKVGIVAIKDYVFPDIRRAPEVFRYDFPTQRIVWIPDMTYKEHFTEFKKELRIYNIKIAYRSCNPLVNDRVFACNKLFYSEHLFITPVCKNLEKALLTHQRDPKTGAPMKGGVNAPDHDSDAFGMAIHYLLSWNRDLKGLYDVTLNRLYSKRRARGADATELEIDTRILSPDKLKSVPLTRAVNVDTNAFNPSE